MKEAIVSKGPKVEIVDSPIPKPNARQVLIKVVFSGSNPKDWKRPENSDPHNSGDDIAGVVEEVGDDVFEFKKGEFKNNNCEIYYQDRSLGYSRSF